MMLLPWLQAAKTVSQALNALFNCLPGARDVNEAIKAVATASQALQNKQVFHVVPLFTAIL